MTSMPRPKELRVPCETQQSCKLDAGTRTRLRERIKDLQERDMKRGARAFASLLGAVDPAHLGPGLDQYNQLRIVIAQR